ncbi:pentatricopeptide repeat-containing protein At4g19191, mitochondrial isoform X2 [Tripterygium wilfordii]|uniref:pentatricopeptide repeat-containing protein At4g19191, mitochondrial isoform X2 n=1 Tax=Tripterygium wilfordii TaxID=458696 RepID=UPI0018F85B49|nr:pentatricopeptide repeat-containing protein At4g19191, mitochondrial isoform X2 [Tripterygium wilfordii]
MTDATALEPAKRDPGTNRGLKPDHLKPQPRQKGQRSGSSKIQFGSSTSCINYNISTPTVNYNWKMAIASIPLRLNCSSKFWTVNQWNFQLREAVNQNHAHEVLHLFRQMKQSSFLPNNLTFPIISKACAKLSNLKCSQMVHTHVVKSPFWPDVFVQTAMVDMYVKCQRLDYAHNLFERMPRRDVASWNVMLGGFAHLGLLDRVLGFFRDMRFSGIQPDLLTVIEVSRAVSCADDLNLVKSIHSFGIRIGISGDLSISNTWIAAYAKCGDLSLSELVFHGIKEESRSVISWNSMIEGHANIGNFLNTLKLYKSMLCGGFRPDISTILSLLSSCVQPEALLQGSLIHSHGIQFGCNSDRSVINTLISMYCKCGDIDSARYLFECTSNRTCVTWTIMISGYAGKGNMAEALTLFNAMEAAGEHPDLVTVLSLISGCGQTVALDLGKLIENYANFNGLKDNIVVCNALIDMYAKCGSVYDAQRLFNGMSYRTVVSWTSMIAACAMNGEFEEALDLFNVMLVSGLEPNHITFLHVLQACNHAGFLEKGWEFFNMMSSIYMINPGLDHYSCMADLLGRKGKLNDTLEFLRKMPVKPDAAMWSALLGACKIHHNVEIGECAAQHLFELEPDEAAPYVELANIYASAGMWDRVARTRMMMKSHKMRKSPGQSVVQVNGVSHAFMVEERSHPDVVQIYEALDSLKLQSEKRSPLYMDGMPEKDLE